VFALFMAVTQWFSAMPLRLTAMSMASIFLAMISFVVVQSSYVATAQSVVMEHKGLALGEDEFDDLVVRAFACPNQHAAEIYRHTGKRFAPRKCIIEDDIAKLLSRVHADVGGIEPYLLARGARCEHQQDTVNCTVVRDVVRNLHAGDRAQGNQFRTVFTIAVTFTNQQPPNSVKIERVDINN
jgi:hypothetical protein